MKVISYRSISILPAISKIYEKIIHARLMFFFTKSKKIHKHQFGLQKGKSTKHAILDIYASILKALEKKQKACYIFIAFAKAFETLNLFIFILFFIFFSINVQSYNI